jgi:hypothetical protein
MAAKAAEKKGATTTDEGAYIKSHKHFPLFIAYAHMYMYVCDDVCQ